MCANVSQECLYVFSAYLNQTYCNKKNYILKMLQSIYNVIEDRKYYYADPIYRKFD